MNGVIVVGAVNVDLVVAADRLPGPGETVVGAGVTRHGGGKGANAAVAAARAGATVVLVGAVGADDTGEGALAELRADGVDTACVAVLPDVATGVALIVVDAAGENQIAVGAGANGAVTATGVEAALRDGLPVGCVLVSTEIPGAAVAAAVRSATAAGVRCVLNPAPVIPVVAELLGYGPLLTPNSSECRELAALLDDDPGAAPAEVGAAPGDPDAELHAAPADGAGVPTAVLAAARLIQRRSGAPVVVTLGGEGALVLAPGEQPVHVPPRRATVSDTTGAGDTFNGVLAARLAAGDALDTAVRTAVAAASLSVGHVGARGGMPHIAAIEQALAAR